MGIIIKGVQMPSECRECPLCQYYVTVGETRCRRTGEVLASGFRTIKFSGRSEHCQLAELPEKHGRLVDVDALIAKYGDWYTEEGKEEGFIGTLKMLLEDAPTVVEAEGECG